MTTESEDNPGAATDQAQTSEAERGQIEASMREFAEGAAALAAASIRMQMMMLEQTREMFGAFDAMRAGAEARNEAEE